MEEALVVWNDRARGSEEQVKALAALGIIPNEMVKAMEAALELGGSDRTEAFRVLWDDLYKHADELFKNLGQGGASVVGVLRNMAVSEELTAATQNDLFREMINGIMGIDLGPEINALADELEGVNPNSAKGQRLIQQMVDVLGDALLSGSYGDLGQLTPEDARTFGNELTEWLAGRGDVSSAVQVARSITEVQSNEVIALLSTIEGHDRRQTEELVKISNNTAAAIGIIHVSADGMTMDPLAGDLVMEEIERRTRAKERA
jgi:hypothetical protein